MTLASATWRECSVHEVHLAWLAAERDRYAASMHPDERGLLDALLRAPADVVDAQANHVRARILYSIRYPLLCEIPTDTVWYEVSHLTQDDVDQLRVIGRCSWDDPLHGDQNQLAPTAARKVAAGEDCTMRGSPTDWSRIVLWGHSKEDALTILEGNHRLVAYAATGNGVPFRHAVFVGLSPSWFTFHLADPVTGTLVPRRP